MTVKDTSTSVVKISRLAIGASKEEVEEWLEGNSLTPKEVRLCGHGRTAFAKLKNADEAAAALQIRKPMRGQRPSVYRSSKIEMEETLTPHDNCVHLTNLPFSVTKADILDFFAPLTLGEKGIFLCLDRKGRQQGEGYVQFVDEEAAKKALNKHEQILLDRIVSVSRSNVNLMQLAEEKSFTELFYRGIGKPGKKKGVIVEFPEVGALIKLVDLPFGVTEEKIKQWFKEEDVVVKKVLLPGKQKKSERVRAFVHLETLDDLKKALQKDRRFMDTDIMMYNVPAWKVKQTLEILGFDDRMVQVKKLPATYTKTDVKDLFQGCQISPDGIYLYSMPKRNGLLGAFVQFTDVASANRALRKDGTSVAEKKIIVRKSSLEKREAKKQILATGKFEDVEKKKEETVSSTKKKNKQNKRKSRKSQAKDAEESKQEEAVEEQKTVKKNVSVEAEPVADIALDTRLQAESRQRRSILKRKSMVRDASTEQEKSLLKSKKRELMESSPKKKRRSSVRFADTPKRK